MRWCVVVFLVFAVTAPAAAQSTYLGASLVGDVVRVSKVEVDDGRRGAAPAPEGEALGVSVRVGRSLGPQWGVEFEFARSGEIDNRSDQFPIPVPLRPEGFADFPIGNNGYTVNTSLQHTTVAALVWVQQELGERVRLAYSGGAAFNRAEIEQEFGVSDGRGLGRLALQNIDATELRVGALVGAEAIVALTEGVSLTAGARLQSVTIGGRAGWLLRPAVGARVTF